MKKKIQVKTLADLKEKVDKQDQTPLEAKEINLYGGRYQDYIDNLNRYIQKGIKESITSDFYIEIFIHVDNAMALLVAANAQYVSQIRQTCPTPMTGQHVWFWDNKKQDVEFVWAIPNKVDVIRLGVLYEIHDEDDKVLYESVKRFLSGEYLKLARRRNGEVDNQVNPIIMVNS